jgi:spore germination protein KB
LLLTALYLRYFAIRLVVSIMPNVNINVFIVSMLVVVAYGLHSDPITLARANEIILPQLVIVIYILFLLMLPNIKIQNLTPISYRDILPIARASLGTSGIVSYFTFIFVFGDRINNKENIKKVGLKLSVFLLVSLICTIAAVIGSLYYTVAARVQVPFLIAVKQIFLFDTFDKIDSIVVAIWALADFLIISFF